jgi:hypothetical protein
MAEKKMKQVDFWIRYFKEHTNTIGCVELDGLDCREVLALLQELADKKADKPNKMEAVAQLFGKKLGEDFKMKWENVEYMCEFTARGLRCYPPAKNDIRINYSNNDWLFLLLIGEAVITNE